MSTLGVLSATLTLLRVRRRGRARLRNGERRAAEIHRRYWHSVLFMGTSAISSLLHSMDYLPTRRGPDVGAGKSKHQAARLAPTRYTRSKLQLKLAGVSVRVLTDAGTRNIRRRA